MSYQGLVRNNNLSDIGNASQAWDNIGSNLSYNYGAIRGNFVDNSAIISQADKSNVVVTQDSGVTLSYGSQYVYRITEASGAPTPYSFGWLVVNRIRSTPGISAMYSIKRAKSAISSVLPILPR